MASVFTHPAPALAMAAAFGPHVIPPRLAVAMVLAAILPDLDVAGFAFGLRYAGALGHRGFSHSLAFALGIGLLAYLTAPRMQAGRFLAFLAATLAVLSHIVLDAATTGGRGMPFFWPFDETRHFLPWRPIEVSPLSPGAFFSARGTRVLLSELRWVWAPCLAFALSGMLIRRARRAMRQERTLRASQPSTHEDIRKSMKNAYLAALRLADQNVNPLFNFLGARMLEAADGKAVIELPVSANMTQGGGVVAGGILATLADEAMAHAVISILEDGRRTTTTEMNIRYLRAVHPEDQGTLRGTARVVKAGRSVITAEAEVHDEAGRLIATAGSSFFVMEAAANPRT